MRSHVFFIFNKKKKNIQETEVDLHNQHNFINLDDNFNSSKVRQENSVSKNYLNIFKTFKYLFFIKSQLVEIDRKKNRKLN